MTIQELVSRLKAAGLLCHVETRSGVTKVMTAKLATTPGNCVPSTSGPWLMEDPSGDEAPEVTGPSPLIDIIDGEITFGFYDLLPPDPYETHPRSFEELLEELLHYWFDADSPMSKDPGFVPGPGRPSET